MSEIQRVIGNIPTFASEAQGQERTVFGDVTQSDLLADNITDEFKRGWGIIPQNKEPTKQDFNGLGFTLSKLISYLYQSGVPEHDLAQDYFTNNLTAKDGVIYVAIDDHNNSAPPSAHWRGIDAVPAHEAKSDPHPQYLTQAEGDALYLNLNEDRAVYVDVRATGNTASATTALAWAHVIYPSSGFKQGDMIIVTYKNTYTYGTGNGSAVTTQYLYATWLRTLNSGWQLIATR